jgi:hypothetical protein
MRLGYVSLITTEKHREGNTTMARKSHTKTFQQEFAAIVAASQATRTMDPAARADLSRRSSGASGVHTDSNIRSAKVTAGRTNRVGSRSAQRSAAVRDCRY